MKSLQLTRRAAAAAALLSAALSAQGPVIINEVHGFGGGTAPPLTGDYIELWNQSATPLNIGGWTVGIWAGNTGVVTNYVIPAGTFIHGNCFHVLQEFGVAGAALSDAPLAGVAGNRTGIGFPWSSNSAIGAFLKDGANVNSDYVYLYRGAAPPALPPNLAVAGTGAAWTVGTVAASGTGNGHMKRMVNADSNTVADWTQDLTANVGTPGNINTSGGATQTSLGACIPPLNVDGCTNGQQNSPQATMTMSGITGASAPFSGDVYTDNEPITLNVSSTTLPGAPFYLFVSPSCNVGHFNDGAGNFLDVGFSGASFCDVDILSLGFAANMCSGGPFLQFANLDGSGNFSASFDAPGLVFPQVYLQAGILDFTQPVFIRTTAATGISGKLGGRYRNGTSLPLAIPDGIGSPGAGPSVTSDIVIASGGTIADLNLVVRINHTWMGDVNMTLTHVESATTVAILTTGTPDDSSDLIGAYEFNDEAATTFDAAAVAAVATIPLGSYMPDGLLSTFDGGSIVGTWRLTVFDNFAIDTGTVVDWSLLVNTGN